MTNLLIIGNSEDIINNLIKHFSSQDYYISIARKSAEIFTLLKGLEFSVIIIDCSIDDGNGFHIAKRIRNVCNTPILMLASELSAKKIADAIDGGVDDYMIKPFLISELSARIKKLIYRDKKPLFKNTKIIVNNLEFDVKNHTMKIAGKTVYLTKTEYRILFYLLMNRNCLVSREKIEKYFLNSGNAKSSHLINMHILNLKKKLGSALSIKTVPRQGFILE